MLESPSTCASAARKASVTRSSSAKYSSGSNESPSKRFRIAGSYRRIYPPIDLNDLTVGAASEGLTSSMSAGSRSRR